MKQILCLLLLVSLSSWAGSTRAQEIFLARQGNSRSHVAADPSQLKTLRSVLTTLEKRYKVSFLCKSNLDQRMVAVPSKTYTSLEEELQALLEKNGLKYQKIRPDFYTIKEDKKRPAKEQSVTTPIVFTLEPGLHMALTQQPLDRTITGKVTAENGEIIPGASIRVKGTSRGTTSDGEGNFQLTIPDAGTLVISSIGYLEEELPIDTRTSYAIVLKSDVKALTEVVVIGYGQQSRKTLSTAVAKVDGKNIGTQPVGTPGEALAALASGVQVQSDRGGTPGAAPTIKIRGVGSFGTGSTPLYVVDGYPLQDATQFTLINPNDIESMEILKDAASAAIYGSRASNGVVIVTTKRGKAGKTVFNFSTYSGIQTLSKKVDVLDRDQYIEHAKYIARVRSASYPSVFDTDPESLPNTDWQDAIYNNAFITNYQLSASGGSEKTRFAISGGYFKQNGILKGTSYERYNLRFNLDADLSPKLRTGVTLAPSYSKQYLQQTAGQFNSSNSSETTGSRSVPSAVISAIDMPPTIPVFTSTGDYGQSANSITNDNGTAFYQSNLFNPVAVLDLYKNRYKNYRLFGTAYLEWEPIKGLKLKTNIGSTLGITDQYSYIPATLANEQAPTANLSNPVLSNIYAREGFTVGVDWVWENTVTYNKSFNNHNFSFLGLYSLQRYHEKSTGTYGRANSFTTTTIENPLASPDLVGEVAYDQNAFLSFAGRLTYDFKSKYIFSAAIRDDASSKFGPNNRFAVFPSISGAWRITEEPFMDQFKNVLSELKLRASYGQTGNANIGNFSWNSSMASSNYSFGGTRTYGYVQSGFSNYDLTWEKNDQTDIGLEAGFFNDRLTIGLDYYNRVTQGMLYSKDLPGIVGYATTIQTNIGQLRNRGLELSAKANLKFGELRWTIDGNISGNRSKVLDLGGATALTATAAINGWNNVYQVKVGDPLGDMHGFVVQGIFKNTDDLTKYAQYTTGNSVGDWIIKDQNGDGVINESDRVKLGKGVPDFIYGMTHTLQYKNFDLTVILQGVQGANVLNGNLRHLFANINFNTTPYYFRNMYDPADPDRDVDFPSALAGGITPGNQLTNKMVFNASFLRVRNITFGYNLPSPMLKAIGLQSARLYLSGQNLFTFTSYNWYNPETNAYVDSATRPGVDQGTYPAARTYTLGINIGF
ncbi:MAG: TonB-dependent receptor [Siphonobacter sp.]